MVLLRLKLFFSIAFLAASLFLSISIGGEFLHQNLHHHASQQEHDDCPLYQLALQLLLFTIAFILALPVFSNQKVLVVRNPLILRICCAFPSLRAPPTTL
jgi:hypothetical protein